MRDICELWPEGPVFQQAGNQALGTDSILLADFIHPRPGARGIDLGCGSGIISLLLLAREARLEMTGLELDAAAAEIARENLRRNGLDARGHIVTGDIRACRELFRAGSFDFAAANPPYFPVPRGALSPDASRAAARSECCCTLEELCRAVEWLLPSGGRFYLVHRPERLSELCVTLTACGLEPKRLRPVAVRGERAPSLVLLEARRGGRPGLNWEAPLLLQNADGGESEELRRIYRRV